MAVGDVISQFTVEGRSLRDYEWQRSARFFTIGAFLVVSSSLPDARRRYKSILDGPLYFEGTGIDGRSVAIVSVVIIIIIINSSYICYFVYSMSVNSSGFSCLILSSNSDVPIESIRKTVYGDFFRYFL